MSNQNIPPEESESVPIDNSDDSHSLDSAPIEPADLPAEPVTTIPPSTNDQTAPPMEIHHHGHVHETKKWKEYLFQFFMLFLAVFCGFLAEYQLEHIIEQQREKKYINSLKADLRKDIEELKSVVDFNIRKFHGLDSLSEALNKITLEEESDKQLFSLNNRYASNIYVMVFSDRTMRQLLSSGNMRLITNQEVGDSIMTYYGQPKEDVIAQGALYENLSTQLLLLADDIFDKSGSSLKLNADSTFYWTKKTTEPKLLTRDKTVLKKYHQRVILIKSLLSVYLQMLFEHQKKGDDLLSFLEQEYS